MKPRIHETLYIVTNCRGGMNYKPSVFHSLGEVYDFIAELTTDWDINSERSKQLCSAVRNTDNIDTKKEILETSPCIINRLTNGYIIGSTPAFQVVQFFKYEHTCHCKENGLCS